MPFARSAFLAFFVFSALSGCAGLPEFVALPSKVEEPPVKIRQEILLSPTVFGVAAHLKKKDIIQARKTEQAVKVEPLVQQLRQKSEAEIRELLGTPHRTLREGRLLVWQYVTEICQWDMYFQENTNKRSTALYDLVIHYRGQILTTDAEIARCEKSLQLIS